MQQAEIMADGLNSRKIVVARMRRLYALIIARMNLVKANKVVSLIR